MKTRNILIMESVWDIIDDLTPEQTHELFVNINRWRTGTAVEVKDPIVKILYKQMLPVLEKQSQNYFDKIENGKKGGRPKKTTNNHMVSNNNHVVSNNNHVVSENNHQDSKNNHTEPHLTTPNHREKDKEKDKERERECVADTTLTPTIQFNKLQSLFDDDPRYYGSNKRIWDNLTLFEQDMALSKAEDYIKWETRSKKDLGFYLQDRKWELDLTISTKSTNDNMEPDWNDPHLDWSKYV